MFPNTFMGFNGHFMPMMMPFPFMPSPMMSGPMMGPGGMPSQPVMPMTDEMRKWMLENQKKQVLQLQENLVAYQKNLEEMMAKIEDELGKIGKAASKK